MPLALSTILETNKATPSWYVDQQQTGCLCLCWRCFELRSRRHHILSSGVHKRKDDLMAYHSNHSFCFPFLFIPALSQLLSQLHPSEGNFIKHICLISDAIGFLHFQSLFRFLNWNESIFRSKLYSCHSALNRNTMCLVIVHVLVLVQLCQNDILIFVVQHCIHKQKENIGWKMKYQS